MPNTQRAAHLDRISFASAAAKTPQAIRRELLALFDAGISWDEAKEMVVPKMHNMTAAFRAEWMDWETERRTAFRGNR
jgi:hypothetical protein